MLKKCAENLLVRNLVDDRSGAKNCGLCCLKEITKFLKLSAVLLAVSILARIFRYSANVIVARHLEVEDFGLYTFFFQLSGYISVLFEIGLPTSIIYCYARLGLSTNVMFSITLTYFGGLGLTTLSVFVAAVLMAPEIINWFGNPLLAALILPYCLLLVINNTQMSIVRAKNWNGWYNLSLGVSGFAFLVAVLAINWTLGISLNTALTSAFLALIIWFSFTAILIWKHALVPYRLDKEDARVLFSFGIRNLGYRLLMNLTQLMPFLILFYHARADLMGFLGVAVFFMSIFRLASQSVSLLLTSYLSNLDDQTGIRFAFSLMGLMGGFLIVTVPLMAFFSESIIDLIYGSRYSGAVTVSVMAIVAVGFESLINIAMRPFVTSQTTSYTAIYYVYSAILVSMLAIIWVASDVFEVPLLQQIGLGIVGSNIIGYLMAICLLISKWRAANFQAV